MYGKIEALMHLVEGSCSPFNPYPAWPLSKEIFSAGEDYEKRYETLGQGPLLVTPVHSGLECGFSLMLAQTLTVFPWGLIPLTCIHLKRA